MAHTLIRAALLAGVFIGSVGAVEPGQLRIATEGTYPPFSYQANGRLSGFDVEIAEALCQRMGAQCEVVPQEWEGMIPNLLAGKYDVIVASMAITAEREKLIAFTHKYYSNQGRFIKRKGDDFGMFNADGLAGKTIAVQSHTTHQKFLEAQYSTSQIVPFPDTEMALTALAAKKVDLVFADTYMLFSWLKSAPGGCCIFVGPRASDPSVMGEGKGIGVRKEDVALLDSLNRALESILQDGTYREINERYFPFSIYK